MEFMDGGTLSDIIDKYPTIKLTELQIRWVIWSVSSSISFVFYLTELQIRWLIWSVIYS